MRQIALFGCFFLAISFFIHANEDVQLRIEPNRVLHQIDEKIYGHFLEHIYHSCNGGLWGELIWDRSFEDSNLSKWQKRNDGVIEQLGRAPDQRLLFGDPNWSDYEFSVEAKKNGGDEGFLLLFRVKNDKEFHWVNLGGWQNKRHGIERKLADQERQSVIGGTKNGEIEKDKWYKLKVRCDGNKVEVFIDGDKILEHEDALGHKIGKVGIGTWSTSAEFRNMKVTSLDGKTLFEGTPEIEQSVKGSNQWQNAEGANVTLEHGDARNGDFYKKITVKKGSGGIRQTGLSMQEGEQYLVSFWYKSPPNEEVNSNNLPFVNVMAYSDKSSTGIGISGPTESSATWKKWEGNILSKFTADDVSFEIQVQANDSGKPVTLCIDQVSVMPKSWLEKHAGMRPDLFEAIAALRPPTIRWPGGCFASAYRWKSGIGPQDDRISYPISIWDDRDANSFGTDEFIELC
ncbi:MAG: family 16 glycoside hydrolase, partial [Thermoguttaceae bacterium]